MNFKTVLMAIIIAFLSINSLNAQNKKIENVASIQLRNMGPILTDSEVTGYYMFYQTDKLSRKVYSYELDILDQNLNKISSKTIEGSKYLSLVDGVYNNSNLLLKFYNSKEKEYTYKQYDQNANELSASVKEVNKMEAMMMKMYADKKEGANTSTFPIDNIGFISYGMVDNKKLGYRVDFFPSNKEYKEWTYISDEKSKELESGSFIYADENIIISNIIKKGSMFSKKFNMAIMALDTKTGKKLYEKEITDPDYELMVLNGFQSDDQDNIYLFGNYFPKGKSQVSTPSLGLFAKKIDRDGNVTESKLVSWEKDVSKYLDVNEKGKIDKIGYIYFHKTLRNADGNIYFIGEQYRKSYKGITTDVIVEDLMVFEFDKNIKLKKVNIIDKDKSVIGAKGMALNGPQILAMLVKATGNFDYEFFQTNSDQSIFSIGYVNYVKVKGSPNKYKFGSITYTDSEPTTDLIDLMEAKEKKQIKVLPAKIGNVVIVEYNEKEKSLDMRIEKINY